MRTARTANSSMVMASPAVNRAVRTGTYFACLAALLACGGEPAAHGNDPGVVEGRVIAVPAVTSELVQRIREITTFDLERFKTAQREKQPQQRHEFKVIFDFNPENKVNHGDRNSYGSCRDLARVIQELRNEGVKTTAFVHSRVSGHTVLPVLACQWIVMSENGELGPVVTSEAPALEEDEKLAYLKFSSHRPSPVLVRKLFEKNLVVVKSLKGGYVEAGDRNADPDPKAILFKGDNTAIYSFKLASQVGLCEQDPRRTREDLARLYDLPRSALQEHPLLSNTIKAGHVTLQGAVTAGMKDDLARRIKDAAGDGVNLLFLELRCGGGDTAEALSVANYLRTLNKERLDSPMMTVAYVTRDARDLALYLALGCDLFVMHPEARLGDLHEVLTGKSPDQIQAAARDLEQLARDCSYPPRLVRAMIDPGIKNLFKVTSARGTREWDILTGQEVDQDRQLEHPRWVIAGEIPESATGHCLSLNAARARELGLAHGEAEDLDALYRSYGLTRNKVREYGDDWINDLKKFLCNPWTSFFLVMIGITCLILELKMPGVSLPGVIAAVCFVLFFWSHSSLAGQITWLAILLFILGLILLAIEIFVLPGFGVCGVSGLILTFGSLGLVAYGQWPRSRLEWIGFGQAVAPFGLSLMGAIILAMILVRYLPSIPFVNRLLLQPGGEAGVQGEELSAVVNPELANLLGAIGVSATPLRPAGKVQFGEQFVDVVAEGSYVPPGTRVQVIEIEGNRVVVKEV